MKKILLFLFIAISTTSFAQINTEKLDSFFDVLSNKNKAMGSCAVHKNGKLIYAKSIGFIDKNLSIAPNVNTTYRIGSISKMFTAVMIFQLIEEKKLTLSTTLNKFFPSVINANKITVEQMLHHNSGIANITEEKDYEEWSIKPITQKEMVKKISNLKSSFEPNEKVEYSNSNFILLSFILEKITKKSFAQNLEERIVKKINLKNTFYGSKIIASKNQAHSFTFNGNEFINFPLETDMSVPTGAGAIVSTPSDLNVFITALFNNKLVTKNSVEKMKTIKDNMGYGMFSFPFGNKKALGHNGSIDGFNSILGYFEKDSLSFSYISNGTNYSTNSIAIGVLSVVFNKPFAIPNFEEKKLDVDLTKLIGNYSSKQLPIKINITTNGKVLTAQATGQSSFNLEYKNNYTFTFEAAGLELVFESDKNQMTLLQGGGKFIFEKEK